MKNILQSALISVILMILWPSWLFSQPESVRWVKSAGGSLDDQATNVAVDGNRNTVVVGFYQGTATFGDTSLAPFGDLDIFIAKYDLEGKLLWVQRAGGASEDKANSVAFDQQGNIFVSGSFDDTVVFGNTTLTAHNSGNPVTRDFFVAKFNPDGDLMWVQQTDASTGTQFALGVAVDSQGNCVVTGLFWISITIGGTTLTEAVSNAQDEIFVFKCDPDGNVLWAKSAGGPGADIGFDIITDSDDNILLTGWSARKVDFGSGVQLTSNSNSEDIFIAKYDKNGNIAWAKNAGSSGEDRGFAIASLGTDFYITGKFQNTIEFDSSHVRFSNGGDDIFAAKYDGSGTLQWLNTAGGSGDDQGRGIAVNKIFSDVELFVTGSFNDRVDFGRDALTSDGADDIFLASYDNFDGDDNWAEQSGGSQTDLGIAVAATPGGNGIVAGLFSDRAQFLFRSATSNGGKDMFVAKYQVDRRSPIAPDSLIATALSSRKILVTWRLNSKNEDNVQVFRKSEHEQRFSLHIELPANSTSYCDSTVVPDTSYTYFVIAININGPSDPSEEDGATSVAAPTDLAAPTAAAFSVQLSWKDRSGKENGYRVRRSKAPETEPNELVAELGINEEKFTDTNVQPNTTYFYRVWAFRGADHGESDPSNRLQIATANINLTWHTAITLSDTCDGKHTLNIGQGQTATDGLDALLGESDSPLLSTGIFDAKLLLGAGLFSKNDFRPDGVPVITWRINIQQGDCGYPAELSWESATMPAGAFRLKDVFSDGGQFDIDMKTQNSLSIDNTAITQIIIEYQQDVSAVDDVSATPGDFTLHPNYPNPFNPSTTITYEIAQPATVLLTIFDPMGRKIRALFHGRQASGLHSIEWDGRDDSGSIVSSGVYFYRLQTIGTSAQQTRKMVFMQ